MRYLAFAVLLAVLPAGCTRTAVETPGEMLDRADRLDVIVSPDQPNLVAYSTTNRRDLNALRAVLPAEEPGQLEHCMCEGAPIILVYAGGQQIGRISNHHGKLVRFSGWKSDAPVPDTEAWLRWFDDRDITQPRWEWTLMQQEEAQRERQYYAWQSAMPRALRPVWSKSFNGPTAVDPKPLRKAMETSGLTEPEQILAVMAWYGSGAGPWSGYPGYETVAEALLLTWPTPALLAAVLSRDLTTAETEGAARLFGGWDFSQKRGDDLRLLPDDLKKRLLDHSLQSDDEDKRSRAQHAFGP